MFLGIILCVSRKSEAKSVSFSSFLEIEKNDFILNTTRKQIRRRTAFKTYTSLSRKESQLLNLFLAFYLKTRRRHNTAKKTCEANPAGENSSFILTVFVKSVPLYHFKCAYVILHMAVKKFFETHF